MSTPVPAGPAGGDRLLRCSPDRTLVVTVDPATGRTELRKILMRGSQADAQREVAIAARLRHLPVVRHLGAELDPVTNRPCVRMELHPGTDLDQLIAERGALPAADACAMLAEVAAALAQMHGLADGGLMHGDLKPGNLLWDGERVLLLDLEHAGPRAGGALRGSFTGGTRGFAPPEAEGGAPPGPAFDVFALGATLHWLVTGGTLRRRALVGQDADLVALLAACTATDPAARPTAAALAERLRRLADRLAADPWQAALQALHAGELDAAARILAGEAPANARGLELLQLLQQRRALLASKAVALASELPPAADMPALRAELRRAQAVLLRLPRHAAALRRRADLKLAAAAAVAAAPERTGALVREAGFAAALAHVHAVLALLH
ncbi:MAG TPA: lipopolysaccharide kinase InaA family protein, partial [Planctomycetota bacterium]|nr:lipopolysaccharide kinase InaA family protein [Planctomycetota bacterium]